MKALDEAIQSWEAACSGYEAAVRAGNPDGDGLEALQEAEMAVDAAVVGLVEGLGEGTAKMLASLQAGIAAQVRIQEHHALQAERTARHGELAGAGFNERERIGQLEYAAQILRGVAASLREAADVLSEA